MNKIDECNDAIAKCQSEQLRASASSGVPKAQLDAKIAALTTERNR